MVSAAQIQPLYAVQIFPEFFYQRTHCLCKRVAVLFAQRVHMEAVQKFKRALVEVARSYAHARAGRAGVVYGVILRGTFGIQPQSYALAARFRRRGVLFQLRHAVEHELVRNIQKLFKVPALVGGRKYVHFAREVLLSQLCLVKSAGGGSVQILCYKRISGVAGISLLRKQNFAPRVILHPFEDFKVAQKVFFVDDKAGRAHQSTRVGLSSICQGRPYLFSASI